MPKVNYGTISITVSHISTYYIIHSFSEFIQTKKYPSWTPVHRIVENSESAPFKQYFATWRDIGMAHTRLIRAANDEDADSGLEEEIDPTILNSLKKSGGRALGFMPDNGEGEVEVSRVEGSDLVALDSKDYGIFFGASSYVVKYHYHNKRGGEGYVIYYWQVGILSSLFGKLLLLIVTKFRAKNLQLRTKQPQPCIAYVWTETLEEKQFKCELCKAMNHVIS